MIALFGARKPLMRLTYSATGQPMGRLARVSACRSKSDVGGYRFFVADATTPGRRGAGKLLSVNFFCCDFKGSQMFDQALVVTRRRMLAIEIVDHLGEVTRERCAHVWRSCRASNARAAGSRRRSRAAGAASRTSTSKRAAASACASCRARAVKWKDGAQPQHSLRKMLR
jgi:hypothetical protein